MKRILIPRRLRGNMCVVQYWNGFWNNYQQDKMNEGEYEWKETFEIF